MPPVAKFPAIVAKNHAILDKKSRDSPIKSRDF